MPVESSRSTSMLRITNPDDDTQYVDVKIINAISFIDPHEQNQEYRWTISNTEFSTRTTHTVHVINVDESADPPTPDPNQSVDVERVDIFPVKDLHDRNQETRLNLIGNAGGDDVPSDEAPPKPIHLVTHEFTVKNEDETASITLQRIDQLKVRDPHDQNQETIYKLTWADDDMTNPSEVDTSHDETETADGNPINPPWRLDPFQNVVNVSWTTVVFVFAVNISGELVNWAWSCDCVCPAGSGPSPQNTEDSGDYTPQSGLLYTSTDGLTWTQRAVPHIDWGIDTIYSINGEFVVTGFPGGFIDVVCNISCSTVAGAVFPGYCAASGSNPELGASAAYSVDHGKTWTSVGSDVNYSPVCTVTDSGPVGGEDGGEKITVTFFPLSGGSIPHELITPWPADKYGNPQFDFGSGVWSGSTNVRIKSNDGKTVTLETSTDDGDTYKETLSVTTPVEGYLEVTALMVQEF